MILPITLIEALVVGAVASGIYVLITGWTTRVFVALWLALSLVAYVGLAGPITVGH